MARLWIQLAATVLISSLATLFATEDPRQHALKACSLAALISLTLFTIYSLDWPYDGLSGVSSDPFQRTMEIMRMGGKTGPGQQHISPPHGRTPPLAVAASPQSGKS